MEQKGKGFNMINQFLFKLNHAILIMQYLIINFLKFQQLFYLVYYLFLFEKYSIYAKKNTRINKSY